LNRRLRPSAEQDVATSAGRTRTGRQEFLPEFFAISVTRGISAVVAILCHAALEFQFATRNIRLNRST